MQTRCPACQTLYRIDEDVLKRAGGQARCFRCDTVFDAYRNLPDAEQAPATGTSAECGDSEALSELSALAELPEVPDADGFGSKAGNFGAPDLSDLAEDLRRPAAPVADDEDGGDLDLGSRLTLDLPDDLPDIRSDSAGDEPPRPTPPRPHALRGALPGMLGALLSLAALGQLAWFNQEQVLATPAGHAVVEGLCRMFGCTLPPRRAPSRFMVLERNIAPDPVLRGVLAMRVHFRNDADFPQPLPDIQLSLYDSEEKLLARRRLHPHEYVFPAPTDDTLVDAAGSVLVTLQLEDPGRRATGFKLEFL